jgi:hypothetical protein
MGTGVGSGDGESILRGYMKFNKPPSQDCNAKKGKTKRRRSTKGEGHTEDFLGLWGLRYGEDCSRLKIERRSRRVFMVEVEDKEQLGGFEQGRG